MLWVCRMRNVICVVGLLNEGCGLCCGFVE